MGSLLYCVRVSVVSCPPFYFLKARNTVLHWVRHWCHFRSARRVTDSVAPLLLLPLKSCHNQTETSFFETDALSLALRHSCSTSIVCVVTVVLHSYRLSITTLNASQA